MSKDSCRDGKWKKGSIFIFQKFDETGAGGAASFELDQDKVTPPTLLVNTYESHPTMKTGLIKRIHYRLHPTVGAATYTLRLWRASVANPYELNLYLLYESLPLQADDIDYDRKGGEVEIPVSLYTPGYLFYSIDWSVAPGVTPGFIEVSGEKID